MLKSENKKNKYEFTEEEIRIYCRDISNKFLKNFIKEKPDSTEKERNFYENFIFECLYKDMCETLLNK